MRTDLAAEDCVLSDHDESSMGRRDGDTSVLSLLDWTIVRESKLLRQIASGGLAANVRWVRFQTARSLYKHKTFEIQSAWLSKQVGELKLSLDRPGSHVGQRRLQ